MSEPTLEWPGAKTTKQAAKYLLTSGFVAVEYCRALTTERDSLRARVAELEEQVAGLVDSSKKLMVERDATIKEKDKWKYRADAAISSGIRQLTEEEFQELMRRFDNDAKRSLAREALEKTRSEACALGHNCDAETQGDAGTKLLQESLPWLTSHSESLDGLPKVQKVLDAIIARIKQCLAPTRRGKS